MTSTRLARRARAALAAAALLLTLGACNGKKHEIDPNLVLPAGELSNLVPQPVDLAKQGLVPVQAQSGPADIAKMASFSSDEAAARTTLASHGFTIGYVVEYANASTGSTITVVVSRFLTAQGAQADLTADLSAKVPAGGAALVFPKIGDQSGGTSQPLPNSTTPGATLVTVRFRVADTTWLVAVGANGSVDPAAATGIAQALAKRSTLVSASPSPAS